MSDKWQLIEDGKYWIVTRRNMFPFRFTISKSNHSGGMHMVTVEPMVFHINYSDHNRLEELKKYFDEQIDKMETQEKRIQELEKKLENLEASQWSYNI